MYMAPLLVERTSAAPHLGIDDRLRDQQGHRSRLPAFCHDFREEVLDPFGDLQGATSRWPAPPALSILGHRPHPLSDPSSMAASAPSQERPLRELRGVVERIAYQNPENGLPPRGLGLRLGSL